MTSVQAVSDECRVLMVSIGYVLQKTPSDKQFLHELIEASSKQINFAMWSLNDAEETSGPYTFGDKTILYRNRNRICHHPIFADGIGRDSYKPHAIHSNIRNSIEINTSLIYYFRDMQKCVGEFKPDLLHLTDSAGPMAGLIKKAFSNIPMTITKPTMRINQERTDRLYRYYVKKSLSSADRTITFTTAAAAELQAVGIPRERIEVIPWGVKPPGSGILENTNLSIRKRYGCQPGQLLIVVTDRGIESGFQKTIESLESLGKSNEMRFVVAIRPTRFKDEHLKWSRRNVVIEKGPADFYSLLEAADAVLSPVRSSALNSSSLLPLAWIEAMVRGTPVITLRMPGVEDLIEDGRTGFLYQSVGDLSDIFERLGDKESLQRCQNEARRIVIDKFNINVLAQKYVNVWSGLVHGSKRCV